MVNRKTAPKPSSSAKRASGGAPRGKAAPARSPIATAKKKASGHPSAPKPAPRAQAAPAKVKPAPARIAKAGPAKAGPSRTKAAKAGSAKVPPAKTIRNKPLPKPTAAATHKPAGGARSPGIRDDEARAKIRLLEQEKAELHSLGDQMRAELDSALAEAARLREHLREQGRDLESPTMRPAATDSGVPSPGGFEAAADLDEDLPAGPEEDLEETAGFFDRMDEIRARRNELDRERNDRELEQSDQPFWMICPKCGDLMEESEGENVKLERCENCGGLYLDRGEVDLILSLCTGPDAYRRLHNILKF